MVIVIPMRSDLRRELPMAEEAFALSPISARAALPSEADYDAIREAFMETARGRWFLSEYTKRNRNADTNLVLEAVTRMEANLAAQKQAPAVISLIEALGAIRAAVRQAKVTAAEAMPRADDDESFAAARNGARIVREIAWTLRECGADTRICDLLDTQVKAIEADQQHAATADSRLAVLASFDVLVQRIERIATGDLAYGAAQPAPAATSPAPAADIVAEKREASVTPLFRMPSEAVSEAAVAASSTPVEAVMPMADVEAPIATTATEASEAIATAMADMLQEAADAMAPVAPEAMMPVEPEAVAPVEAQAALLDAEAAHDLAVLDMVAMEMAALDISEPENVLPEMVAPDLAGPEMIEPARVAPVIETMAVPEPVAAAEPVAETPAPSLGAALIANGVISNPNTPTSDPLAPIRRMSQAEKIAFFS
jgi:hypothetical protein